MARRAEKDQATIFDLSDRVHAQEKMIRYGALGAAIALVAVAAGGWVGGQRGQAARWVDWQTL
jgi:hypothetical protein